MCERAGDFGPRFIKLPRSVDETNDRRAAVKRRIRDSRTPMMVRVTAAVAPADCFTLRIYRARSAEAQYQPQRGLGRRSCRARAPRWQCSPLARRALNRGTTTA
jgi:hypothetical protein